MRRVHFTGDKFPNGKIFAWMETWDCEERSDVEVRLVFYVNDVDQPFAFNEFREAVKNGCNHETNFYYYKGPVTDLSLLPDDLHGYPIWVDPDNEPEGMEDQIRRQRSTEGISSGPGIISMIDYAGSVSATELAPIDAPIENDNNNVQFTI